ncbi:hypothetical protein PR048_033567 [Dryococelus australis]|uniref:Uncharacterized protein n=1 Tax=Dryococelus australis TaxID=614101 RepID=A0ABQ9G1J2_9NEOP|nr:hypothetical protein PR048_033567 [Dryococelus australis]
MDTIDCKSFYTIKDILLDQYHLGSPLVDDRPIVNAVKYRVVPGVVWTNRTMCTNHEGSVSELQNPQWLGQMSKRRHQPMEVWQQPRACSPVFIHLPAPSHNDSLGDCLERGRSLFRPVNQTGQRRIRNKRQLGEMYRAAVGMKGLKKSKPFCQFMVEVGLPNGIWAALNAEVLRADEGYARVLPCRDGVGEVQFSSGSGRVRLGERCSAYAYCHKSRRSAFNGEPIAKFVSYIISISQIGTKIDKSEIQNHDFSLVLTLNIGTKIKLDPVSELESFDLGSGKMLVQLVGAAVADRLACSPPTMTYRAQFPAGSLPDFHMWESCRLDDAGFLGDLPFPRPLNSGASPHSPRFTLIGSQYLDAKSHPNLSTLEYTALLCGNSAVKEVINPQITLPLREQARTHARTPLAPGVHTHTHSRTHSRWCNGLPLQSSVSLLGPALINYYRLLCSRNDSSGVVAWCRARQPALQPLSSRISRTLPASLP